MSRPDAPTDPSVAASAHVVRLGVDELRHWPFDVALPAGVGQHTTLLGVTGAGKTTAAARLAEAAAPSGLSVLIVDAKGGSLHVTARRIAAAGALPYRELVPGAAGTLGYHPCAVGSRSLVADKLGSAFSHGPDAQIYRSSPARRSPSWSGCCGRWTSR